VLRHKNAIIELELNGKTETVLVKSASKDVVTQVIEHVDLVEIVKGERVHVEVPVHIVGESMSGTVIDLEHKTVKIEVDATTIPEFVEVVFHKEGLGFHVTAGDIKLPAGAKLDLDDHVLVATVIGTGAGASDETEAAPAAAAAEAPKAE
jgi:large subunit ribosomal protein L25